MPPLQYVVGGFGEGEGMKEFVEQPPPPANIPNPPSRVFARGYTTVEFSSDGTEARPDDAVSG